MFAAIAALESHARCVGDRHDRRPGRVANCRTEDSAFISTTRGKVLWILFKLVLAYLLIGYTGGVSSSYYLMLLLPIISAATALDAISDAAVQPACLRQSYLSFLGFIDWYAIRWMPDAIRVLILRLCFLADHGRRCVNALALAAAGTERRAIGWWPSALREAEAAVRRSDGWPRSDSSPPAWLMSCAIRWAPSRLGRDAEPQNVPAENAVAARNGRLHLDRSGPHQLAGHPLPAFRAPAAIAAASPPISRRCSTARSNW